MGKMPRAALVTCLALGGSAAVAASSGAPIIVAVSGIGQARGTVHVDVCPEKQFTQEKCPWSATAKASAGTTVVRVNGVPPGRYAAQAYWDVNANGKADRNFIGMPTELVGFSRDVKVSTSRPKFSAAAFDHGDGPTSITFAVRKIP